MFHRNVVAEKKTNKFCTKEKYLEALLQLSAATLPTKLSEWLEHGINVADGACCLILVWRPLYLPDIFAALSYDYPRQYFVFSDKSCNVDRTVFSRYSASCLSIGKNFKNFSLTSPFADK